MTQIQTLSEDKIGRLPLEKVDVSDPALYQNDNWYAYYRRLRREDPVHYCADSPLWPLFGRSVDMTKS
jgi:hypothetical protein